VARAGELRIYFEGDPALRVGMRKFFSTIADAASRKGWHFAPPVATKGRPVQAFLIALQTHPTAWNVLLLDQEDSDEAANRKQALADCDRDSVFWMIEIMESWFLADLDALRKLFGANVKASGNPNVEGIPKKDVIDRLKRLAKGDYQKVKHGVRLLASIDPAAVRRAAPDCERMFTTILAKLS
jgi:hypothetical protein